MSIRAMSEYHVPVLLAECIQGLQIKPDGVYVDVTFGGGGHSKEILKTLGVDGRLIGFDQDEEALRNALDDNRFTLILSNFQYMQQYLRLHEVDVVDGVLADLGVSSHQFDEADRGFSYRFEGSLDMRMNAQQDLTAADLLNKADESTLIEIFSAYGEVRNTKTLVRAILAFREHRPFGLIEDLVSVVDQVRMGNRIRYLSQVFQALRMAVNDEVAALEAFLEQSLQVLRPGGRLVVITYHSIEDRIVKRFMKTGNTAGHLIKDEFGRIEKAI